jgi:hypothetical protein
VAESGVGPRIEQRRPEAAEKRHCGMPDGVYTWMEAVKAAGVNPS